MGQARGDYQGRVQLPCLWRIARSCSFRKSRWWLEGGASNLQLAVGGASGDPPDVKLLRLGNSTFGFALQVDDMHGGEVTEDLEMYGPLSGIFTKWFAAELQDLDPEHEFDETCRGLSEAEMGDTCVWYRKTYSMAPRRGYEMYDLLVRRRVIRSFSKKTPVGTTVHASASTARSMLR
jgi:hypothetical protein